MTDLSRMITMRASVYDKLGAVRITKREQLKEYDNHYNGNYNEKVLEGEYNFLEPPIKQRGTKLSCHIDRMRWNRQNKIREDNNMFNVRCRWNR